jgi:hypothetical protein
MAFGNAQNDHTRLATRDMILSSIRAQKDDARTVKIAHTSYSAKGKHFIKDSIGNEAE